MGKAACIHWPTVCLNWLATFYRQHPEAVVKDVLEAFTQDTEMQAEMQAVNYNIRWPMSTVSLYRGLRKALGNEKLGQSHVFAKYHRKTAAAQKRAKRRGADLMNQLCTQEFLRQYGSVSEAAKQLGVNRHTLARHARTCGLVPTRKLIHVVEWTSCAT